MKIKIKIRTFWSWCSYES